VMTESRCNLLTKTNIGEDFVGYLKEKGKFELRLGKEKVPTKDSRSLINWSLADFWEIIL
jgi:hypothetical protein